MGTDKYILLLANTFLENGEKIGYGLETVEIRKELFQQQLTRVQKAEERDNFITKKEFLNQCCIALDLLKEYVSIEGYIKINYLSTYLKDLNDGKYENEYFSPDNYPVNWEAEKERVLYEIDNFDFDEYLVPMAKLSTGIYKSMCNNDIEFIAEIFENFNFDTDQPQQTEPLDFSNSIKPEHGKMEKKIDYLKFITETFFETLYPVENIEQENEPTECLVTVIDENDKVISSYTTTTTPSEHPFEIRKDLFIDKIIRKQKTAKKVNYITLSEFSKECNFALKQLYDYIHSIESYNSIGNPNSIDLKGLNSSLKGSMTSLDICFVEFLVTTTFDNLILKKNRKHKQPESLGLSETSTVEKNIVFIKEPYGEMFTNNGFELFEHILNEYVKPKNTTGRYEDLSYYYRCLFEDKYIHQKPEPFRLWFIKKYNEEFSKVKTKLQATSPHRKKDYSNALDWFKLQNK